MATAFAKSWIKCDSPWLKQYDSRRAAEGEVAFFLAFFDQGIGFEGLVNGTNASGTNFHQNHGADIRRLQMGDRAFVLPKITQIFAQCDRRDREQWTVDDLRVRYRARDGKVETMIVDGAQSR